jgi:hypothetical protein
VEARYASIDPLQLDDACFDTIRTHVLLFDAQPTSPQWKVCSRSVRVDHVENYRLPKQLQENEEQANAAPPDVSKPGLAYHGHDLASSYSLARGQDLFAKSDIGTVRSDKSKHDTDGRDSKDGSNGPIDDSVRRRKKRTRPPEKSHKESERQKKEKKSRKKKKRRRRDSSDEG